MIELEWFTAPELAKIAKERGLKSSAFPNSAQGVIDLAKRDGWNKLPDNLCRIRTGSKGGGGREYHRTILPEFLQNVILARGEKHYQLQAQEACRATERKKVDLLPVTSLRFRQRNAMEARGEILVAIDRYATLRGMTARRKAILDFVRAQDEQAERNAAKDKAEAGEPLSGRERMLLERPSLLCHADGFGLLEDTLRIANDRSGGSFKVSRATVYDWFAARDALGITALAPALTKEDEPVSEEFKAFLPFYAKGSKLAATEALKDYKKENPASTLTVEQVRYTLKHKLNDIERNVGREGLLTLRSRMAYISRSTDNLFPTTIYTADGKTFDAEVEHPYTKKAFKPEITSILDVATRRCVGFAIAFKENVMAVTEALRNSCVAYGIPAIFYTDRGPGYKNQTFDADVNGLMGRLSITKMHALPYNSQAKGIIERFNGTVWNPLAQRLPTYLGKPMDKEAAKAAHKTTRREIAEIGTSTLLPTWDDFRAMCVEANHTLSQVWCDAFREWQEHTEAIAAPFPKVLWRRVEKKAKPSTAESMARLKRGISAFIEVEFAARRHKHVLVAAQTALGRSGRAEDRHLEPRQTLLVCGGFFLDQSSKLGERNIQALLSPCRHLRKAGDEERPIKRGRAYKVVIIG